MKSVTEEKRRRIRDFVERRIADSKSMHEVELQRAGCAQPAARQVGRPLEDGLAAGYIGDPRGSEPDAGDEHSDRTTLEHAASLLMIEPRPRDGAPPPLCQPPTA